MLKMAKKDIIYIFLLAAILAALLTLVMRTEVQAEENIIETTENVTEETTTEIETTTEAEPTTIKFEDIPEYEELGTYKLTAYCACSECCGKSDGITASGVKAQAGRTVAAKNLSFGTELMINGEIYTVEDRGVGSGVVDIFFDSHSEALDFGVKYAKVYEVIG
jgi:3D (Asp-Asp-Asp) domain-containing protein